MKNRFLFFVGVVFVFVSFFFAFTLSGSAQSQTNDYEAPLSPDTTQDVNFDIASSTAILSELKVRQAIAYCTDRWALARAAYPELTDLEIDALMMDSFLPSDHWGYTQPTILYPYDPDQGRALLEEEEWFIPEGEIYRYGPTGELLALQLTSTWAEFRYAWGDVFEQQMRDCGIYVPRLHADPYWWFNDTTGLAHRNFEIGGFAWDVTDTPYSIYGCDQIPSADNGWQGLNFMGWCNPAASDAAEIASDITLTQEERIPYLAIVQEEFAQDLPSLPLFLRADTTDPVFWEHIDFNLSSPPPPSTVLNDLKVRQAIAYCTDRWALARAVYPELTDLEIDALMMDSFLPSDHWAYTQPSTQYPFDPNLGRAMLEEAGWIIPEGEIYRYGPNGELLALQLTSTWAEFRYVWGELFEQQMRECGIYVPRLHADPYWWFNDTTGLAHRNFEIGGFAWDVTDTPYSIYGCDQIPSADNGWQGQNFMGWCNPAASDAAEIASDTTLTQEERIPYLAIVQEEFAKDLPSLPLFLRADSTDPVFWEHIDFNLVTIPSRIYLPQVFNLFVGGTPSWKTFSSPTIADLEALDFVSQTDGWAVGAEGTILHWNGSSWSSFTSPTVTNLKGIDMLDTVTGWAIGENGTIISWNGTVWSNVSSPTSVKLADVSAFNSNDAWAVGDNGTLLHWDGVQWSSLSSPTTYDLYALDFVSPTDGWVVGGEWNTGIGWYEAAYLHWNGSSWSSYTPVRILDILFDVDMVSSTYGVAVGLNNAKSFWNGTSWNSSYTIPSMTYYYGVDFLTASDGWAVGWMYLESNIQHWDGVAWSRVTSPVTTGLTDVAMLDADHGWAVGQDGVILRYSH